jgi:hypothetical protein
MSKKSNTFSSIIAVLLAVVIAVSVVMSAQSFAEKAKENNEIIYTQENVNNVTQSGNNSSNVDDTTISDVGGVDEPTDTDISETPADGEASEDASSNGAFSSTEEIVAYFNTCANKVKTDATKVVKNFEKRSVDGIVVPNALQSTAETMMNKYMADDTEPIVYATKEEIRDNFIVPNQDYVSCLKASDVVKADYKDNGKEYVIYLKIKDEKNPRAGSGVGAVCDVIETYEIADKAGSLLKEFSTEYYNCEVTATIDKETGRMTHAVYKTPLKMLMVVNMFGTHSVGADITFTKDYSITY